MIDFYLPFYLLLNSIFGAISLVTLYKLLVKNARCGLSDFGGTIIFFGLIINFICVVGHLSYLTSEYIMNPIFVNLNIKDIDK